LQNPEIRGFQFHRSVYLFLNSCHRFLLVSLPIYVDHLGIVELVAGQKWLEADIVELRVTCQTRCLGYLVQVFHDTRVIDVGAAPGDDVRNAHRNRRVCRLDVRHSGTNFIQGKAFSWFVHWLEGFVGSGVQGQAHPVVFIHTVGNFSNFIVTGAV